MSSVESSTVEEVRRRYTEQAEKLVRGLRCAVCREAVEDHFYPLTPFVKPVLRVGHMPLVLDLTITPRVVFSAEGPQFFVSASWKAPS